MIRLKTESDIEQLKISGKILVAVIGELQRSAVEGVSLLEIDQKARKSLKEFKAKPSFLDYHSSKKSAPFPAAICASVNDGLVHGIPDDYRIKSGDVLKIDLGVDYNGFITDGAVTVGIGKISSVAEKLLKATKAALEEAIKICKAGNYTGDIGWIIENVAKNYEFSIAEKLTGHGVGFEVHEDPSVYNFGERGSGILMENGLVIAIEPMIIAGSGEVIEKEDGSFFTKDGSLSAHFEKTIAVTENGCIDLTPW